MLRLIPGDPAHLLLGEFASPSDVGRIREKLGLDSSYPYQYYIYVKDLFRGDMGVSIRTNVPVSQEIFVRFLATVELSLAAMVISSLIGIMAGVISSVRKYSAFDYCSMVMALAGISMPIFWLGLMLMYLFSVKLGILPMMGRYTMGMEYQSITGLMILDSLFRGDLHLLLNSLWHLILPAFTLATIPMAIIARMTRSSMLEVMSKDYIRTARAKGLSLATVVSQACPEECFSSDHYGHWAQFRPVAWRSSINRDHLLMARTGQVCCRFSFGKGLSRCPGLYPLLLGNHGAGESGGRHPLLLSRPEAENRWKRVGGSIN